MAHLLVSSSGGLWRLVLIEFDTKYPIVLDGRHSIVNLRHTHLSKHHQGVNYLRSKVHKRYAIHKLRFSLRSIKSNCVLLKVPCCDHLTNHVGPPKKETTNSALIALARFTLPFVGLPRRVGTSLYLSDYAYCPCWSCCVHRHYFLFNWIEAVCLPQGYICGDLASWCYDFHWSGKRALNVLTTRSTPTRIMRIRALSGG